MSETSRLFRFLPAVLTVLALVAGCATVNDATPNTVGKTPKEDTEAGIERWGSQTVDQRAWIENACPRENMGPDPWKRCTERHLQAIQTGLPDLTALTSADRTWIENACPREVMGPGPWKRCAERNLQALQTGLPDLTALTSADRTWIENACPREVMGPGPWKRCAERNLQALQAGLPDLTALTSADRAWIENACPREVMGPGAPWKRCAERNLQAAHGGLPEPEFDASGASQDPASASRVDHKEGGESTVATPAEPPTDSSGRDHRARVDRAHNDEHTA